MTSTAEAMLGGIASSSSSQPNDVMAGTLPGESPSISFVWYNYLFSTTNSHQCTPTILKI